MAAISTTTGGGLSIDMGAGAQVLSPTVSSVGVTSTIGTPVRKRRTPTLERLLVLP